MADLAGSRGSLGVWYTWWKGDALTTLPPLPGFAVEQVADSRSSAVQSLLRAADVDAYLHDGHRLYIARIDRMAVGYGWCATSVASIGELNHTFTLPPGARYLWDFVTAPAWRGRGVYPHLLQAILTRESAEAERFWIGHAPQNAASARGITKAGFQRVGELYALSDGSLGLLPDAQTERNAPAAAILGVRLLTG
ncbi:MAG TPA: GNAT family protein [Ktedonobacterales bacterium]